MVASFSEDMNRTLISLIPKQDVLECLTHFRPISLCNVVVKIISKVVANHLRPLMAKLTAPNQSSFVPTRQATDNIVLVQEVIHSLKNRKGRKGGLLAKIDLEKAYDRVDLKFLERVLLEVGFSRSLIDLIMYCISSANLSVLWNGHILPAFKPTRGMRQGDPLSPYLFVLCMEVLGQQIQQAVTNGQWKTIKLANDCPSISHLSFADDLLLVREASVEQARLMNSILTDFYSQSGQKINLSKLKIWMSLNVKHRVARLIRDVPLTSNLGTYLGVPLHHERVQKNCNYFSDWMDFNLNRPEDFVAFLPCWSYIFREATQLRNFSRKSFLC